MFPTELKSFSQVFETTNLIIYVILSFVSAILLFYATLKFLLVLQQSGYKSKKYFKWLGSRETPYLSRLMLLCLLGFLFFMVLSISFAPIVGELISSYVGFISYYLFTLLYINTEKQVNAKVPLRKTARLIRLAIVYVLLLAIVNFGLMLLLDFIAYEIDSNVVAILRYSIVCGLPILTPYLLFLAHCVTSPFERWISQYYIKKAKRKLEHSSVLKIGITGSYAKTSTKEILRTILSQKYRVLATPSSYNTPLGIALTVKQLDSTHDIFIAEMGARSKGDIKTLAEMVKPTYGVITGINSQHLETFGNEENIKNTKYELIESLDNQGKAFFNSDNIGSVELFDRFDGEKHLAGLQADKSMCYATDIELDSRGTSFTLNIKGEEPVRCTTVLLGKHAVSNICLAAAVAYKIGLTPEEIANGINRIQTLMHRLELLPNNRDIIIIDDSYNSNEDGVKAAMEVLDTFKGRKIVLTPGLVELGKMENVINLKYGKILAQHADFVFVIGKHNAEMLVSGLIEGGMPRENIRFSKSLNKANEELNGFLQQGDVVLFENDLPDNYS